MGTLPNSALTNTLPRASSISAASRGIRTMGRASAESTRRSPSQGRQAAAPVTGAADVTAAPLAEQLACFLLEIGQAMLLDERQEIRGREPCKGGAAEMGICWLETVGLGPKGNNERLVRSARRAE